MDAADDELRRRIRRLRELVRFLSSRKVQLDLVIITKGSPQFARRASEMKTPGSGMFLAMSKSLVNEDQPFRGRLHAMEVADDRTSTLYVLAQELKNLRPDCSELLLREGVAHRLELLPERITFDQFSQGKAIGMLKHDGVYVVVGGAREHGLSALVAKDFIEKGAGTVVVVGRSPPDAGFEEFMQAMKLKGKKVLAIQANITKVTGTLSIPYKLLEHGIESSHICGVCHGAAVWEGDKLFSNVNDEAFDKTLEPKMKGSLALHVMSEREKWDLDFKTYFSSVVVSLGNLGQVAYAGANGFQADLGCMQSLRNKADQRKCKVQVINFTVLKDTGVMHNQGTLQEQLENTRGFPAINVDTILQMLQAVLCMDIPMITVATFNRQKLPDLPLAKNPGVASRFHSVMRRYSACSQLALQAPVMTGANSGEPGSNLSDLDRRFINSLPVIATSQDAAAAKPNDYSMTCSTVYSPNRESVASRILDTIRKVICDNGLDTGDRTSVV